MIEINLMWLVWLGACYFSIAMLLFMAFSFWKWNAGDNQTYRSIFVHALKWGGVFFMFIRRR